MCERDQPMPGSFPSQFTRPGNEVDDSLGQKYTISNYYFNYFSLRMKESKKGVE